MARQLRSLLKGLGIDPNDLEVRVSVRQAGEPGRPRGGGTTNPAEAKASMARMAGRLIEALTSLCQAGERFVDSATMSSQQMARTEDEAGIRAQGLRMIQSGQSG
jgi:hypothetical protein